MQIIFLFSDNVRILCLSCNIKRSKTTAKFSENSWNKRRSKHFQRCHLWHQCLYYYHFFLLLNRNGVPEKLYLDQSLYIAKKIASQCNLTAQIEPVQDKMPLTDTGARLLNKYWCQLITIDFFLVLYQPYYQSLIKQHQLMNQSKIYVWKIMNDCQLDPGWNIWYAVAGLKFLWGTIIQNVIWFWHKYRNC